MVGHKENGAFIFRYISAGNQKELTDKLRQSIEDYRAVELTEDSCMTLAEWLERWLEEYAAVRPSTLAGYRQYIEGYIKPRLGEKKISKVTAEDVRRLYRELQKEGRLVEHPDYGHKLSGSTIRNIHGVFREAMDAAVREGLTARNPTEGVTPPKKKPPAMRPSKKGLPNRRSCAILIISPWGGYNEEVLLCPKPIRTATARPKR